MGPSTGGPSACRTRVRGRSGLEYASGATGARDDAREQGQKRLPLRPLVGLMKIARSMASQPILICVYSTGIVSLKFLVCNLVMIRSSMMLTLIV
jgi:hypothetical protein